MKPVHIDIDRMNRALHGPFVTLPRFRTRAQFIAFMDGSAAAFAAMSQHGAWHLTAWYRRDQVPARRGWYLRDCRVYGGGCAVDFWDGDWYSPGRHKSLKQRLPWCGLLEPAE